MRTWRRRLATIVLGLGAVALAGCATGMRQGHLGRLPTGEHLVTLVISEDRAVVRAECPLGVVSDAVLGCQTSREVRLGPDASARVVKIVRFTDRIPSPMAFEIEIHELCHAVAALQPIADPCHIGNGGVVQHYPAALPRQLLVR